MADFLYYLIKASICSIVFYSFYYIFLRKGKYFLANRFYLVGSIIASLILPVLHLNFNFFSFEIKENNFLPYLSMNNFLSDGMGASTIVEKHFTLTDFLTIVYFTGLALMILRLIFDLTRLFVLAHKNSKVKSGRNLFVLIEGNKTSFSFFHLIFFDKKRYLEDKISKLIIEHEKVHSKQLHSLDLLAAEFYIALLWFNPFAFFHRNSVKVNHEYLADSDILKKENCISEYLGTLANEVFNSQIIGLSSNFNCSIKKRLIMITKINSSKHSKYRFLLLLPLLAIMLYLSAKPVNYRFKQPLSQVQSASVPSICPIKDKDIVSTSGFGWRTHPITKKKDFHQGIDLKATEGTPILATADGVIVKREFIEEGKGYGRVIVIKHDNIYSTVYAQLSEFKVNIGDKVKQGDVIGLVGHSGLSTGPHLHYEVLKEGKNVDPKDYFK